MICHRVNDSSTALLWQSALFMDEFNLYPLEKIWVYSAIHCMFFAYFALKHGVSVLIGGSNLYPPCVEYK